MIPAPWALSGSFPIDRRLQDETPLANVSS
jgi:hypothetical protein